jgi:hypothetical protein
MTKHKKRLTGSVLVTGALAKRWIELTLKRLEEDVVFFCRAAESKSIDGSERRRFSRVAILLMAFYVESLSNFLFDIEALRLKRPRKNVPANQRELPKALRHFCDMYFKAHQKELSLDLRGLWDLFTIRDLIAHPPGWADEIDTPNGRKPARKSRRVSYKKFEDFPQMYSQFCLSHAKALLPEIADFVVSYLDLMKQQLRGRKLLPAMPELPDLCWPSVILEYLNQFRGCVPRHLEQQLRR